MKKLILVAVPIIIGIAAYIFWPTQREADRITEEIVTEVDSVFTPLPEPKLMFGIEVDSMVILENKIKRNQSLSDILLPLQVSHQDLFAIANNAKPVFDVRKIRAGRPYTILISKDSTVSKLIYEPNTIDYVIFHFGDSIYAEEKQKRVDIVQKELTGIVDESLAVTIEELGESVELTNRFVDVFAWVIDFWKLQKGDHFKILYSEKQVEGVGVGIAEIEAIYFNHFGNDYWAYSFDQGNGKDFFDEKGNSLRKALLKYPLEFSRISSRYSLSRFHPVQKRWKAHRGTDFSARTGTPIRSVGDGVVTEARYQKYNGNYVKIRHNATYTTQYLHMSKIANGIKPGTRVRQGQLIGLVGSTGLATGPHLCYRFWKNGVQVDALKVELPPSEPIDEEHFEEFTRVREQLTERLNAVMPEIIM